MCLCSHITHNYICMESSDVCAFVCIYQRLIPHLHMEFCRKNRGRHFLFSDSGEFMQCEQLHLRYHTVLYRTDQVLCKCSIRLLRYCMCVVQFLVSQLYIYTHCTCSFMLNNVVNIYILCMYSMYMHKGFM